MQYLTVFRVGNEYGIILIKAAREEPLSVRFCGGLDGGNVEWRNNRSQLCLFLSVPAFRAFTNILLNKNRGII